MHNTTVEVCWAWPSHDNRCLVPPLVVDLCWLRLRPTQASKGKQTKTFYTMPEYESWKESLGGTTRGWRIKYYKGLGTSTSTEAKEYFADIDRHRKKFVWSSEWRQSPA